MLGLLRERVELDRSAIRTLGLRKLGCLFVLLARVEQSHHLVEDLRAPQARQGGRILRRDRQRQLERAGGRGGVTRQQRALPLLQRSPEHLERRATECLQQHHRLRVKFLGLGESPRA